MIPFSPFGPPVPKGGWRLAMADDFNRPFGDPLWHLNRDYQTDADKDSAGFNPTEVEVFNRSAISQRRSVAVITARYAPDVAPGKNYVSGCMTTAPVGLTKQGFLWMPGQGDWWAFEIRCQLPPDASGEAWPAFWTAGPVDGWEQERDFFEGQPHGIDTDWIYSTNPKAQDFYSSVLPFDWSAGFHTLTYLIDPNQSWSVYIDGQLQTWVGANGVAPSRTAPVVPMQVIVNYSLRHNAWATGSREFLIDYVAVWTTGKHFSGGGIAPGTVVG